MNEKNCGQSHRPLGKYQMHQHLNYGDPRRRKWEESEKIFKEIIVETFPNMGKKITKFRKYRISYTRNPREILNTKKKILKTAREKQQITYKRICIRLKTDLLAETLHVRKEW